MKKLSFMLLGLILVSMISVKCKKEKEEVLPIIEEPKPTAGFTYGLVDSADLLTFKFHSSSTNYKDIIWQFGDDSTSVDTAPVHSYKFYGEYRVTLTTRNSEGYWAKKEIMLDVVNPDFNPALVGINLIQTIGGVLTVSRDNGGGANAGEGSLKVVDGRNDTKFLQSDFAGDLWMKFEFNEPQVVKAYTLVSGNDAPSRDPRTWTLQGSLDNIKWEMLDSQAGIKWQDSDRRKAKIFHFNNDIAYKYYRINIKSNNGSRLFQLSEWTLNESQPE